MNRFTKQAALYQSRPMSACSVNHASRHDRICELFRSQLSCFPNWGSPRLACCLPQSEGDLCLLALLSSWSCSLSLLIPRTHPSLLVRSFPSSHMFCILRYHLQMVWTRLHTLINLPVGLPLFEFLIVVVWRILSLLFCLTEARSSPLCPVSCETCLSYSRSFFPISRVFWAG